MNHIACISILQTQNKNNEKHFHYQNSLAVVVDLRRPFDVLHQSSLA